ncbi:MAG TPA: class I SAM-dependent methyltransferase [Anaerolineaceae bacterium]|nr:class I SAM-dependent methyltransferase [Anaerolineaceae bacterium]HPN50181.1 class I SAM-dependent methyltransferase [Anaerolineaceae bacterium]
MPAWNELFKEEEHRLIVPHQQVVRFSRLLKQKGGSGLVFDLGCGAGRHTSFLQKQGFRVIGMDISPNGLLHTQAWLEKDQLTPELYLGDMTHLALADESVDALISIHVIFHNPIVQIRQTLSEMFRVLKPGGLMLFSTQSIYSTRFGNGRELEYHTYVPDMGIDTGIPHHYFDLAELAAEITRFKTFEIVNEEQSNDGTTNAHWFVLAQKPHF